jgi:hypothetical protein
VPDLPGNLARPFQVVGRTLTLVMLPTRPAAALGPAWAALCGACVSGHRLWTHADRLPALGATDSFDLVRSPYLVALAALILTLFLAEILWSTWRALLIDMDWPAYVAQHPLPALASPVPKPLYVTPWSPLGRILRKWDQVRRWARETLPPERQGALLTLPILLPLILLVSAAAGERVFILSLAVLALTGTEWLVARRGRGHAALQAGLEIGLSWLAGHVALGQLTWSSLTLACCYAIAYQGALSSSDPTLPSTSRRSWSLGLFFGGQAAAIALLVLLQHPLAATLASILVAPQLLLLPRLETSQGNLHYLKRAVPFLMLAMPLAAWAV